MPLGGRGQLLPHSTARIEGTQVTLTYDGLVEATPCATPGHCGAGDPPPKPHFSATGCEPHAGCPLVVTDVDAPAADGKVAFTVLPVTPARFDASVAVCRARSAAWSSVPTCRYLFAIADSGHATRAQTDAIREALEDRSGPPAPAPAPAERRGLDEGCRKGSAAACVTLAKQLLPREQEAAIDVSTRACRLKSPLGCELALALLGNESSKQPKRVLAVLNLACRNTVFDIEGCTELVHRLRYGIGVKRDPARAAQLDSLMNATSGALSDPPQH